MTHHEVAFEIDGYDEATNEAWSVVVVGMARVLSREADLNLADTLPLSHGTWIPSTITWLSMPTLSVAGGSSRRAGTKGSFGISLTGQHVRARP